MRVASLLPLALLALGGCGVRIDGSRQGGTVDASGNGNGSDSGAGGSDIDAAVAPPDARACAGGDDHATDGTSCFVYVKALKSWADAEAFCETTLAAHLAIVTSADQNTLIAGMIGTAKDQASTVFLGGTDAVTEGTWKWTDGTEFWLGGPNGTAKQTFTNWGPTGTATQPNNDNGNSQEDCLTMRGDTADTWFDRPCDTEAGASSPGQYGFICEF